MRNPLLIREIALGALCCALVFASACVAVHVGLQSPVLGPRPMAQLASNDGAH